MVIEHETSLPGRAGGIEPGNRFVTEAELTVLMVHRKPAIGMHEYRTHRSDLPRHSIRDMAKERSVLYHY